jgi:hypothetical protein
MGGSDDPSNLIEVTIQEHAELHLALYLEHGKMEDWIAFHMLSGKTTDSEWARREAARSYMTNRVVSQSAREAMSDYNRIRVHSKESREKRSKKMSGNNNPFFGKQHDLETKEVIREKAKEQWKKTKYIWVNNGEVNKRVPPDKIPAGFKKGRIYTGWNDK